jgi:Tol biopolymer transport system component
MFWDVASRRELLTINGHTDEVDSLSWSPDGKRLATESFDGAGKVWDVMGGRAMRAGRGSPDLVIQGRRVCWSPDGARLATVSENGVAKVWDARDGRPLLNLKGHRSAVSAISWSPDSQRLATASADGNAILWDVARERVLVTLQGHTSAISIVTWSPDGRRLASSSAGYGAIGQSRAGEVKIWDTDVGRELLTLRGYTGKVHSVSWSPDGKRLATASDDGTVKIWDASCGRELLRYTGMATSVSWSPDGKRLASGSKDGTVRVWEAASDEGVQEWIRRDRALHDSMDGNALRGPHAEGFIRTWLLLLPFPISGEPGALALDRQQLPGEAQLQPRPGQAVPVGDRELIWQEHRSPGAIVDFNAVLGRMTEWSVAYAVCYIESDRARDDVWLQVASDDQAKVYLNGGQIWQFRLPRPLNDLETVGPVTVKQGTNALVFKVVNETNDWEGCVRLVDAAGRPAQGIRVKLTSEP